MIDWITASGWLLFLILWLGYREKTRQYEKIKLERQRLSDALEKILGRGIPSNLRRKLLADLVNQRDKKAAIKAKKAKNDRKPRGKQ